MFLGPRSESEQGDHLQVCLSICICRCVCFGGVPLSPFPRELGSRAGKTGSFILADVPINQSDSDGDPSSQTLIQTQLSHPSLLTPTEGEF